MGFSRGFLSSVLLTGAYFLLMAIFSIKTIYYFSYQKAAWLMYFSLITCAFTYAVYHRILAKPNWVLVFVVFSVLIGCVPYEVEYVRIMKLVGGDLTGLSGFAKKMPKLLGVLFDVFFYPSMIFISLSTTELAVRLRKRGKLG